MVGMEHCSCQMSFFQGCIDEVRPWVKVIGICVNVNRVYVVFSWNCMEHCNYQECERDEVVSR